MLTSFYPIKVCVVNPDYYRSSGVTVAIKRIFEDIDPSKVEQHFVSCSISEESDSVGWVPEGRLKCFRLMSANPFVLLSELYRFALFLRRMRINVLHSHHRRLAILCNLVGTLLGIKTVYTAQLAYENSLPFALFSPRLCCATGPSVAENVRQTTRIQNVIVTGNPANFPNDPMPFQAGNEYLATCVARLETIKGHEYLIKAWAELVKTHPQCCLALVGEGSLRQSLGDLVKALGLSDAVRFIGYTPDPSLITQTSLFSILVSRAEGLPLAAIEASALGRALLVTDAPGNRELVPPDSRLPNLIRFGDMATLANTLRHWFSNINTVKNEGEIFRRFLREQYDSRIVARKYQQVYENILK